METLLVAVVAATLIIAVTALAPRAGVAAPLVLVLIGVGVSFVPGVPAIEIDPELVLAGVLPALLYASAASFPAMDFRRELTAISGMSVLLVILSAVLLGLVFSWVVPGIDLAAGIALGAIVSPTDAVATSIIKRLGAPPRVVVMLDGEGLLNDATSLVLLRSAVAATAASVSLWSVVGDLVAAVLVAAVCGVVVGRAGLAVRSRLRNATLSTAVSFVVPFAAYLPAEALGASGIVAAVAAGLVTGALSARHLRPQDRISEESNWRMVEVMLEGALFLFMGLQLFALVEDVEAAHGSLALAGGVAAIGAVGTLVVRTAFMAPMLAYLAGRRERGQQVRAVLEQVRDRIAAGDLADVVRRVPAARAHRWRTLLRRAFADFDYLAATPLGPREGIVLVWAGMRGAVTLAAAQTLPAEFPHRSLLVLVAFGVAAGTLLLQGGTLPWVVRRLRLADVRSPRFAEGMAGLRTLVSATARELLDDPGLRRPDGSPYAPDVVARALAVVTRETTDQDSEAVEPAERAAQFFELRLATLEAQRAALLEALADGLYDSDLLNRALELLDADQIAVEMRRDAQA